MKALELNPQERIPLLKLQTHHSERERVLPVGAAQTHPRNQSAGQENASIYFIGTATTVLEWSGIRILTDPNFLHAGDHVHLGPGVTAERLTNPAVDIDKLPPLDCILLSHYHEDHFDRLVEDSLDRQFPIISTPHAKKHLTSKPEPFQAVHDLDFFESMLLPIAPPPPPGSQQQNRKAVVRVTGMPGKHVPPGPLNVANEILGAVPPTNGWLLELGYIDDAPAADVQVGYRICISGGHVVRGRTERDPQETERRKD
ncbi:hypothetical protein QBC46DRAFT_389601 [Diplogelasinospora grovesii]|uniref:Metallo-beta-lactamase domain-containing protein n=1 Tax=Diplogelasinospora grovesii TaxID=303347 RepID=A0AAN6N3U0_9PEZI|nr:hypothetical protein QBC46DRAFT_389601 [Diplogelasinospora grovesii]